MNLYMVKLTFKINCVCYNQVKYTEAFIMALTVEDGTIVPDADSFLSLVDARSLATNYGITLPDDDVEAEITLRNGYMLLLQEERNLQGSRVSAEQTGIFPRKGVLQNCFDVASDIIPQEVKMAQLYGADAINNGASTNNVDDGQRLKSFNVDGVYSETYQDGSSSSTNASIQGVENQLFSFTKAGLSAANCGGTGGFG